MAKIANQCTQQPRPLPQQRHRQRTRPPAATEYASDERHEAHNVFHQADVTDHLGSDSRGNIHVGHILRRNELGPDR